MQSVVENIENEPHLLDRSRLSLQLIHGVSELAPQRKKEKYSSKDK
jgi:hypothetical protein